MFKKLTIVTLLSLLVLAGIFFIIFEIKAQLHSVTARVQIRVCGNGIKEDSEECDGSDFGGYTCANYGYDSGNLTCDTSCTIDSSGCYDDNGGGGGGGGGGGVLPPSSETSVSFSGRAYPMSAIFILKDGQVAVITIAGQDANFSASLTDLSAGNYIFSLYAEDINGKRSSLFTFSTYVSAGAQTSISGIFIAPSIGVNKSQVKQGDNIAIFGQSTPKSEITIVVNSDVQHFSTTDSDEDGIYLYNFNSAVLEMGNHIAKSKTSLNGDVSNYSKVIFFCSRSY